MTGCPDVKRQVRRLTQALEKERHFSANASHQLRTLLTGLQLGLDAALQDPAADLPAVLADASARVGELHLTVDEVLALARLGPDQLLSAAEGRRLVVTLQPEVTTRQVPASLVTQILNVLLDNAFRHGRGAVTLTVREMGETVAIDVGDEGSIALEPAAVLDRGTSGGNGQSIGLGLARAMAEASGARLLLPTDHLRPSPSSCQASPPKAAQLG